jgi:hypothetical protein
MEPRIVSRAREFDPRRCRMRVRPCVDSGVMAPAAWRRHAAWCCFVSAQRPPSDRLVYANNALENSKQQFVSNRISNTKVRDRAEYLLRVQPHCGARGDPSARCAVHC